jgi:hypothetical protein
MEINNLYKSGVLHVIENMEKLINELLNTEVWNGISAQRCLITLQKELINIRWYNKKLRASNG